MHKLYSNKKVIFSLMAPGLIVFVTAILAPIILSVYYGFTNYSGIGSSSSLFLAIGFICIQHPFAILTAIKLDKLQGKAEGLFRCIFFIPNVISVAVIAYLWKFIYNPNFGLITKILKTFGYAGQINPLGSGNAIWAVLVVLIWHGFGWGMLIYYTGVKNIDPVMYEAASIDGASGSRTFFYITLPLMKPVIQVNVTMAVISALKQMETVYLLTAGGPGNETQFMASYLYKQAFQSYKYGYGNLHPGIYGTIFFQLCGPVCGHGPVGGTGSDYLYYFK
ncbi:carbohydrate ABC transporter permease [Clostridium sp. Marseille-P2415]|uniref:carbohydrate ABC transporter permease n=1 Tax=Clostridium sp. Marseille-P2415 TaxID=1805471 RepID=UPI0009882FC3|nr:sugar ABC transporter permease [Clostridium sp. Marseille-P2415]